MNIFEVGGKDRAIKKWQKWQIQMFIAAFSSYITEQANKHQLT